MDQSTYADLLEINEVYNTVGVVNGTTHFGKGTWKPTPFNTLFKEVQANLIQLYLDGIVLEGKLLVPGSGDARRGAYFNRIGRKHDLEVVCIDINPEMVRVSNQNIDALAERGLVDRDRIDIVQGDFLDDSIYESLGLKFGDFALISAYLTQNNFYALTDKIEEQSPSGTVLFALRLLEWPNPIVGLEGGHIATIEGKPRHYDVFRFRKTD